MHGVTGHRKINPENLTYIKDKLQNEISLAIKDGYINFVSRFADGTDLIFAEIVAELKETHSISLTAAIPY